MKGETIYIEIPDGEAHVFSAETGLRVSGDVALGHRWNATRRRRPDVLRRPQVATPSPPPGRTTCR